MLAEFRFLVNQPSPTVELVGALSPASVGQPFRLHPGLWANPRAPALLLPKGRGHAAAAPPRQKVTHTPPSSARLAYTVRVPSQVSRSLRIKGPRGEKDIKPWSLKEDLGSHIDPEDFSWLWRRLTCRPLRSDEPSCWGAIATADDTQPAASVKRPNVLGRYGVGTVLYFHFVVSEGSTHDYVRDACDPYHKPSCFF